MKNAYLTFMSALLITPVQAADINEHGSRITIEGRIDSGDYEKVDAIVGQQLPIVWTVVLASPGGDLAESMRIGELIRKMKYETEAPTTYSSASGSDEILKYAHSSIPGVNPQNTMCASSCFMIYVAGVKRSGNVIGIHRPYLSESHYKNMTADEALDIGPFLRELLSDYLDKMGISQSVVDASMEVPSDSVKWLDPSFVDEWIGGFIGQYVPEFDSWLAARCPKLSPEDQEVWDTLGNRLGKKTSEEEQMLDSISPKYRHILDCKGREHLKVTCDAWAEHYYPAFKGNKADLMETSAKDVCANFVGNMDIKRKEIDPEYSY